MELSLFQEQWLDGVVVFSHIPNQFGIDANCHRATWHALCHNRVGAYSAVITDRNVSD
jgi:hypothetical protein